LNPSHPSLPTFMLYLHASPRTSFQIKQSCDLFIRPPLDLHRSHPTCIETIDIDRLRWLTSAVDQKYLGLGSTTGIETQGTVSFGNLLLYSRFFSSAENHENRLCFFTQPLFMPRFQTTLCPQTEQFREQNNCNNFRICSKVDKV
jgi:hypothetical protein